MLWAIYTEDRNIPLIVDAFIGICDVPSVNLAPKCCHDPTTDLMAQVAAEYTPDIPTRAMDGTRIYTGLNYCPFPC